jgi:hypothetical protein
MFAQNFKNIGMKKITLLLLVLTCTYTYAQEEAKGSITNGWVKGGNIAVTFNQSAFNNEWTGGGISNIAANVLVNYDFNLKKGDLIWDNKIIADYGAFKNKGQGNFTKSNDRLEFNSTVGKKSKGYWYYSGFFNFKTQMDTGFTDAIKTSHFFSPAYFQMGPGMLWKKSDNLHVNISPAAAKLIIVHDEYAGSFGTDLGKTKAFELGASIRAYYKLVLIENVSMENLLALYSDYLEDPQNVDIDYTINLVMVINKYLSANLTFQAIYDDNTNPNGFQIRETFGIGMNYNF